MFTRRGVIAGAGSLAWTPAGFAAAPSAAPASSAEAEQPVLKLEAKTVGLRLRPEGPDTVALSYGGPEDLVTLRVRPGQDVLVRLSNSLAEPTSLIWSGIRGLSPNPSAQAAVIAPGAAIDLRCRFPDSGTYWFHPAPGPNDQASRGLSGVLIVEEPQKPAFDQDIVAFLGDWALGTNNETLSSAGDVTTVIAVNRRAAPGAWTFRPGSRLRLRLVNGSTRRVMVVACDGARPFILAIDGQPSDLFEPVRGTVPIGPGGRFDYVFDLPREPAKVVRLVLKGTERLGGTLEADRLLATISTDGAPLDARPPIAALPPNPLLPRQIRLEASKRAALVLAKIDKPGAAPVWTLNGVSGSTAAKAPLLKVKQGDAVTLGFENKSDVLVPLRVSGQALRLLHAKDDGWEPYWRESVLLLPQSRNHVAFVADTPGRFAIESAFDAQALGGLRGWFEVVRA